MEIERKYVQQLKTSVHWHISAINTFPRPILTQHRQQHHTIKDRKSNINYIIIRWVGVCSVPEVLVEFFLSNSSWMDRIFPGCWYVSRTPRVGWVMNNEFGEIRREDWVLLSSHGGSWSLCVGRQVAYCCRCSEKVWLNHNI